MAYASPVVEGLTVVTLLACAVYILVRTSRNTTSWLFPGVRSAFLRASVCLLAAAIIDFGDEFPHELPVLSQPFVQVYLENGLLALGAAFFAHALYNFLPSARRIEATDHTLREHEQRLIDREKYEIRLERALDDLHALFGPDKALDLDRVLKSTGDAINVDHIGLWSYSEQDRGYVCRAAFDREGERSLPDHVISERTHPEYLRNLRRNRALVKAARPWNVNADEVNSDFFKTYGNCAYCDVSIDVPGVCGGMISAISKNPEHVWNYAEVWFVRAVGDLVIHEMARNLILSSNENLSRARAEFEAIANYTYNLEMWLSTEGEFVWINPAVERITGYRLEECLGNPKFPYFLAEGERESWQMRALLERIADTPVGEGEEFRIRRKDGSIAWVATSWQSLAQNDAGVSGTRVSIQDITHRKLAEETLSASERQLRTTDRYLRTFVENTSDAVMEFDSDSIVVDWNQAAEQVFGWTRDEIVGKPLSQIFHPEKAQWLTTEVRRAFGGAVHTRRIVENVRKDGRPITCEWRSTILHAMSTDKTTAVSVITDITEQLEYRRGIETERNRFRDFSRAASDFFYELDAELKVTFVSERGFELMAYDEADLIGKSFYDVPNFDLSELGWRTMHEAMQQRIPYRNAIVREAKRGGGQIVLSASAVPVFSDDGKFMGYRGTGRDVSADVRQEHLKDMILMNVRGLIGENYFLALVRTLVTALPVDWAFIGEIDPADRGRLNLVAGWGPNGEVAPYSFSITTAPAKDVIKNGALICEKGIADRYPHETFLMRNGIQGYAGIRLTDTTGKELGVMAVFSQKPLEDPDMMRSVLGIFGGRAGAEIVRRRTETERAALQQQLIHSQRMETMGAMAGGIAHDFNNILTPIMGYAEILVEDLDEASPNRTDAVAILNGAKRAKALVRQILDFSRRSDSGQLGSFDLVPLAKGATAFLSITLPSNITVETQIDESVPVVDGDPTKFDQVLINLLTNASHAIGSEPGKIVVKVSATEVDEETARLSPSLRPGPAVRVSVVDDGCGMSSDIQCKVFEPYFTTKGSGKGTGFGLSTVKGIVEAMGGVVSVKSVLGEGSEFHITLPASDAVPVDDDLADEASVFSLAARLQSNRLNVLYVDDEQANTSMAVRMIEKLGHSVTWYEDPIEALKAVRSKPYLFDCIITDDSMVGMSGDELCAEVVQVNSHVPIIVVSGSDLRNLEGRYTPLGVSTFVAKPFLADEVVRAIKNATETSVQRLIEKM